MKVTIPICVSLVHLTFYSELILSLFNIQRSRISSLFLLFLTLEMNLYSIDLQFFAGHLHQGGRGQFPRPAAHQQHHEGAQPVRVRPPRKRDRAEGLAAGLVEHGRCFKFLFHNCDTFSGWGISGL